MAGQQNSMGGARGRDASLSNAVSQRRKDDEAQFARLLPILNQTNADTALGYLIGQILNKPFHNWLDNMFMPKNKDGAKGTEGQGSNAHVDTSSMAIMNQNGQFFSPESVGVDPYKAGFSRWMQEGVMHSPSYNSILGDGFVAKEETPEGTKEAFVFDGRPYPISTDEPDARNFNKYNITEAIQDMVGNNRLPANWEDWKNRFANFQGVL